MLACVVTMPRLFAVKGPARFSERKATFTEKKIQASEHKGLLVRQSLLYHHRVIFDAVTRKTPRYDDFLNSDVGNLDLRHTFSAQTSEKRP